MKRSVLCSILCVASSALVACGDDDGAGVDASPIVLADAAPPDSAPVPDAMPQIDAQLFNLQPALGFNEMSLVGTNATYSALAPILNGQLNDMIGNGSLLLVLELRDLDDPSGQNDEEIEVGFYNAIDPDGDSSNNFVPDDPDRWVASPQSIDSSGNPLVVFESASIAAGVLSATSTGEIAIPGLPIMFAVVDPQLEGFLEAAPDDSAVYYLRDEGEQEAFFEGVVTARSLAGQSNFGAMLGCPGDSMLDLFINGCETQFGDIPGSTPDTDRDGDGVEVFCDTCADEACAAFIEGGEADAGAGETPDGNVSCCIDKTGEGLTPVVTTGTDCPDSDEFADGYRTRFNIEGTRIILMSEVNPG